MLSIGINVNKESLERERGRDGESARMEENERASHEVLERKPELKTNSQIICQNEFHNNCRFSSEIER